MHTISRNKYTENVGKTISIKFNDIYYSNTYVVVRVTGHTAYNAKLPIITKACEVHQKSYPI